MYKYSASTGGFYLPDLHAEIPDDAVEITESDHTALLAGQADGKVISAGPDGAPVLIDPALPPVTWDSVRARRDWLLTDTQWLVDRHRDQTDAGSPTALTAPEMAALLTWRQALRDLPATYAEAGAVEVVFPVCPVDPLL